MNAEINITMSISEARELKRLVLFIIEVMKERSESLPLGDDKNKTIYFCNEMNKFKNRITC